jgi:hypothetical protein
MYGCPEVWELFCHKEEEHGYVRFGSKADMCAAKGHVRFTPIADMCGATRDVRFGPKVDMRQSSLPSLSPVGPRHL